jgi:hypothetical protein
MDLTQISLFPATREQIQVHRKRTFQEWGRGLALEEYIKRDEAFDSMPHSMGGKFVVWLVLLTLCFLKSHRLFIQGFYPDARIPPI